MCGDSGKGRSGEVHRYYKCVSTKKRRAICSKKSVRKDWIEDIVVNATMKMLMSDTTINAIVSALMTLQDAENVNLPLYEKQLKETNVAINNLLNAIQAGILNRSTKERFDQLEATRDELENKIAAEKLAKPRITEEQLRFFLDHFRKLDVRLLSHRRMLIDTFINAVFLYDDKLVLTYNFREGTETITFDDLKNKLGEGFSGSDMSSVAAPVLSVVFHPEDSGFFLYILDFSFAILFYFSTTPIFHSGQMETVRATIGSHRLLVVVKTVVKREKPAYSRLRSMKSSIRRPSTSAILIGTSTRGE